MPHKKAKSEKNQPKISFFTSEKENPWSEDETNTGTTTEANKPIEVYDDVSHEASENKEQGKFPSRWSSLYTWLTYDKDKNKMYCSKLLKIVFGRGAPIPRPNDPLLLMMMGHLQKLG